MKQAIYEEVTNSIIDLIETKRALPWEKDWQGSASQQLPSNFTTSQYYNGINILILWAKSMKVGFSSNQWVTYKQAQTNNLQVRKGEKATKIVYYKTLEIEDKDADQVKKIPMLKTFSVFNLDQMDGREAENNTEISKHGYTEANQFLVNLSSDIRVGEPCFSPSGDYIRLPAIESFNSAEAYFGTSFHEHAHWTGHKSRLNRVQSTAHANPEYAFEEIIADLSSAFLCAQFNIQGDHRHAGYIDYWLKVLKSDKQAIFKAAAAASKACQFMHDLQPPAKEL